MRGLRKIKKKNTIKVIIPIRHPVGGIRTYLKYTYRNMVRNTYNLTIVSPDKKYVMQLRKDLRDFDPTIATPENGDDFKSFVIEIWQNLRRKKYDLIHSQGFTAGLASVMANILCNVPHIMTSHDVLRDDQFSVKFGMLQRLILGKIFGRIETIHSVSEDAHNNLLEFLPGLWKSRVRQIVIHNGIDLDNFADAFYSKNTIINKGNDFIIGFIGRYMPQKGYEYLPDILDILTKERHHRGKFRIVSVGAYGGFFREFKKLLEQRNLLNWFEFVRFQENINQVMREIDLLVMPSRWEACPILPMEALVSGTPIVAFSCIGLKEVLADTPAITVAVGDVNALASAIFDIMENYDAYQKKFVSFVPIARERYNVKAKAGKLEEEIERLLGRRELEG